MARLSETEKAELLEDANNEQRARDLAIVKAHEDKPLSAMEYVRFVTRASKWSLESVADRPLISGNNFVL